MPKPNWKVMNKDGSLNAVRKGFRSNFFSDTYHYLLSLPNVLFFGSILFLYFVLNCLFALAYFLCGPSALQGPDNSLPFFLKCFFFSIQTIATIGYGHIHPSGIPANLIVALESFVGIMGLAVFTGLFFARFSRPTARVAFSKNMIIAEDEGVPCLMFRAANERSSHISEARVNLILLKNETAADGSWYRKLYDLKLQRNFSPVFALSWTIVHEIDAASPLYGMDKEKLSAFEPELLVSLTGTDDVFAQSVSARAGYRLNDIVWNEKFKDMITRLEDGRVEINLENLDLLEPLPEKPAAR